MLHTSLGNQESYAEARGLKGIAALDRLRCVPPGTTDHTPGCFGDGVTDSENPNPDLTTTTACLSANTKSPFGVNEQRRSPFQSSQLGRMKKCRFARLTAENVLRSMLHTHRWTSRKMRVELTTAMTSRTKAPNLSNPVKGAARLAASVVKVEASQHCSVTAE